MTPSSSAMDWFALCSVHDTRGSYILCWLSYFAFEIIYGEGCEKAEHMCL